MEQFKTVQELQNQREPMPEFILGTITMNKGMRGLWHKSIYSSYAKYSTKDFEIKMTQAQMLGILYVKHWRDEVVGLDKSMLMMIQGPHRSAKSTSAVAFACLIDKTFWKYFEKRIVITPQEFMNALEVIEKEDIHGGCIVVDEAGISMANDAWYEKWMQAVEKAAIVFGKYNPIVFFCSLQKDFISSKLRKMSEQFGKFKRFDKDQTTFRAYTMEWSVFKKDYIYRKPVINLFGQKITIRTIYITKPPQIIIDRYKRYENEVKPKILAELRDVVTRTAEAPLEPEEMAEKIEDVCKNYKKFLTSINKDGKVRIDKTLVLLKYRVRDKDASKIAKQATQMLNEEEAIIVRKAMIEAEDLKREEARKLEKFENGESDPMADERTQQKKDRKRRARFDRLRSQGAI